MSLLGKIYMTEHLRLEYKQVMLWLAVFSAFALVWQLRFVLPLVNEVHPASDVLAYLRMSEPGGWFGATHLTWRIGLPALSLALSGLLGFPFGMSWMILQWIFFLGMMHLCWKMSSESRQSNMGVVGWLMLIPTLPVFWRYLFLPMSDIAAGFFVALCLFFWQRKKTTLYFMALIIGILFKEMVLIVLILPLWELLFQKDRTNLRPALLAIILILAYAIALVWIGDANRLYTAQPKLWWTDWMNSFSSFSLLSYGKHLLSAFGLLWILIVYRIRNHDRTRLIQLMVLFHVFYLFTPDNAPRLAFMLLPFLAYVVHPAEEENLEL